MHLYISSNLFSKAVLERLCLCDENNHEISFLANVINRPFLCNLMTFRTTSTKSRANSLYLHDKQPQMSCFSPIDDIINDINKIK